MSEWTVVSVIIAIVGLVGTVAVPLSKNTKAMTQLSEKINHLAYRMDKDEDELSDFKSKSAEKHRLIFDTLGEHQKSLINHESRIYAVENKQKKEK